MTKRRKPKQIIEYFQQQPPILITPSVENKVEIDLNKLYSPQEWDKVYRESIQLLENPNPQTRASTWERLKKALRSESDRIRNDAEATDLQLIPRFQSILEAIATLIPTRIELLEEFWGEFGDAYNREPYSSLILPWLNQLASTEIGKNQLSDRILAAKILFGGCGANWTEAGTALLAALDHQDLTVRACASDRIGRFCLQAFLKREDLWEWMEDEDAYKRDREATIGIPTFASLQDLIRTKEIERPGVAGPFFQKTHTLLDSRNWLLDVLAQSPHPEPYIRNFSINLAFEAHERFSKDPDAIRRLIDMGRTDIAVMAATDESLKIPEIEPLLIEIGHSNDLEIARLAAWHLAYHYHHLHPQGAELEYVELVSHLTEIDLFLLFSRREPLESPYAAVIYPKHQKAKLSRTSAQKWVDKIFPASVRGSSRENLEIYGGIWYENGYIDYQPNQSDRKAKVCDRVIIGYRSNVLWHPKHFL
jgi:hypothetical protein